MQGRRINKLSCWTEHFQKHLDTCLSLLRLLGFVTTWALLLKWLYWYISRLWAWSPMNPSPFHYWMCVCVMCAFQSPVWRSYLYKGLTSTGLSLLFIMNVTQSIAVLFPHHQLTGRGHHYDWLQRKRGKTTWNISQTVKVNAPNTTEQRRFHHHTPISYLLLCIADNINRDGEQLLLQGVTSSLSPQACWDHSNNRLIIIEMRSNECDFKSIQRNRCVFFVS